MHFSRSPLSACAVTPMIGVCVPLCGFRRADRARRLVAVHLRHRDVHQDQLGPQRAVHLDRGAAIAGDSVAEAEAAEDLAEHQLVHLVVLGDQDVERRVGLRHVPRRASPPQPADRLRRAQHGDRALARPRPAAGG